jgi:hypothetical protein
MVTGAVKLGVTKTCLDCGEVRPLAAFTRSGLACDECEAAHDARRSEAVGEVPRPRDIEQAPPPKVCKRCGEEKPVERFSRRQDGSGHIDTCKDCASDARKKDLILDAPDTAAGPETRKGEGCGKEKTLEEFRPVRGGGRAKTCRACFSDRVRHGALSRGRGKVEIADPLPPGPLETEPPQAAAPSVSGRATSTKPGACVPGKVHFDLCGDVYIEAEMPDFFLTHEHTDGSFEWQVCKFCGREKKVHLGGPIPALSEAGKKGSSNREAARAEKAKHSEQHSDPEWLQGEKERIFSELRPLAIVAKDGAVVEDAAEPAARVLPEGDPSSFEPSVELDEQRTTIPVDAAPSTLSEPAYDAEPRPEVNGAKDEIIQGLGKKLAEAEGEIARLKLMQEAAEIRAELAEIRLERHQLYLREMELQDRHVAVIKQLASL